MRSILGDYVIVGTVKPRTLVEVELSKEEMERAAVETVTVNGLPPSVFEKSGICKLLSAMLDKLGLNLNRSNMNDRVIHQANVLRQQFSDEAMGKLVSLKFDIASRKVREFLGINVQYVHEERLQIRTLGIKEMFKREKGER